MINEWLTELIECTRLNDWSCLMPVFVFLWFIQPYCYGTGERHPSMYNLICFNSFIKMCSAFLGSIFSFWKPRLGTLVLLLIMMILNDREKEMCHQIFVQIPVYLLVTKSSSKEFLKIISIWLRFEMLLIFVLILLELLQCKILSALWD